VQGSCAEVLHDHCDPPCLCRSGLTPISLLTSAAGRMEQTQRPRRRLHWLREPGDLMTWRLRRPRWCGGTRRRRTES
jgi:hypothetical protein